jgi:hypothetical protein
MIISLFFEFIQFIIILVKIKLNKKLKIYLNQRILFNGCSFIYKKNAT